MAQTSTNMNTGTNPAAAGRSQGNTGTSDVTYNLISIVYHALQGAETYEQYIRDAEQGNDHELAKFFRDVQQENERRATRGRELLARCLSQRGDQRRAQ